MPKKKKENSFDPENMSPEEKMKFEIASELGLADKVTNSGWRSLTAKESGRIGGLITKRKRELAAVNSAGVEYGVNVQARIDEHDAAGDHPLNDE